MSRYQSGGGGVRTGGPGGPRGGGNYGGGGGGYGGGGPRGGDGGGRSIEPLFDPSKDDAELFDTLAEKQANDLLINSNQLRKYFGEVKDLWRRFETLAAADGIDSPAAEQSYQRDIAPLFRMLRSKVAYGLRPGGQAKVTREFADFLSKSIAKVHDAKGFRKFVFHFEAVVGFMYGNGKVTK